MFTSKANETTLKAGGETHALSVPAHAGGCMHYTSKSNVPLTLTLTPPYPQSPVELHQHTAHHGKLVFTTAGHCKLEWHNLSSWFAGGDASLAYSLTVANAEQHAHERAASLRSLIEANELDKVLASLEDAPTVDPVGRTPLHEAARLGSVAAAEALLERGCAVDARAADGSTPLLEACAAAQPELVRLLLGADADVGAVDARQRNVFHKLVESAALGSKAVQVGERTYDVVLSLLGGESGLALDRSNRVASIAPGSAADVAGLKPDDEVTHCDGLPLHGSLSEALKERERVRLTVRLDRGPARLQAHSQAIEERVELALDLLLSAHPSAPSALRELDSEKATALELLAGGGIAGAVARLLRAMAPLGDSIDAGFSAALLAALVAASGAGALECARLLLKRARRSSIALDTVAQRGNALHAAARGAHAPMLRLLLDRTSDVAREQLALVLETTDEYFRTPLLCAAGSDMPNSAECVSLLLRAGSPLEARDGDGVTALMRSAAIGAADVTATLLAAGACAKVRDAQSRNALSHAAAGGHMPLLPLLLPQTPKETVADAMFAAATAGHLRTALALVELCPMPCPPPDGDDALRQSANGAGRTACAKLMEALWRRAFEEASAYHAGICAPRGAEATTARGEALAEVPSVASSAAAAASAKAGALLTAAVAGAAGGSALEESQPCVTVESAIAEELVQEVAPGGEAAVIVADGQMLEDVASIQELIRMELEADSDEYDESDPEEEDHRS